MEKEHYIEILRALIAARSVSSESNMACIEYIEAFLSPLGFVCERVYNSDATKANLVARIGPEDQSGIMLAAHTDVVPVSDQVWESDPFALKETGDLLIGRGVCDMKGFIALVLCVLRDAPLDALKRPIHLAFTYDEEIGCGGAMALHDLLSALDPKPDFVLIGEPTDMEIAVAHKGICIHKTLVCGKPAHSARPDLGANAIAAAADMISQLPSILPDDENPEFTPPRTTMNVGEIKGGSAINILAERCEFSWEYRPLPGLNLKSVQEKLGELSLSIENARDHISVHTNVQSEVPALKAEGYENAVEFLKTLVPAGTPSALTTIPFVTEGGLYQQCGIPAIIYGPGSLAQAHQPDENVSVSTMNDYGAFLQKLIASLS